MEFRLKEDNLLYTVGQYDIGSMAVDVITVSLIAARALVTFLVLENYCLPRPVL